MRAKKNLDEILTPAFRFTFNFNHGGHGEATENAELISAKLCYC